MIPLRSRRSRVVASDCYRREAVRIDRWPGRSVPTVGLEFHPRTWFANMDCYSNAPCISLAQPDAGIGPVIDRGFLNPMSPAADMFVEWFEQTFA